MSNPIRFTIAVPTYNRAQLLPRLLESIERQHRTDIEVIVVDDGSTDHTRQLIEGWSQRQLFPVAYHWQKNSGKQSAVNRAAMLAKGEFFVVPGSDDMLPDCALDAMEKYWRQIPGEDKDQFAGIMGLVEDLTGKVLGKPYPQSPYDANQPIIIHDLQLGGERFGMIRTRVMQEFPCPVFPGEKYIRGSIVQWRLATCYKVRYVNEVFLLAEYQSAGLSADKFKQRILNPNGFRLYFQEIINLSHKVRNKPAKLKHYANYIRFSLHSRYPVGRQLTSIRHPWWWFLALPRGVLHYVKDRQRLKKRPDLQAVLVERKAPGDQSSLSGYCAEDGKRRKTLLSHEAESTKDQNS